MKSVKVLSIISLILITIVVISGCGGAPDSPVKATGVINITIGSSAGQAARNLDPLNSAIASANSDLFEVLIYNASTLLSAIPGDAAETISLSVNPGTYTVMVIAGTGSESNALYLGSGYRDEVEVIEDTITDVTITLMPAGHELDIPETVNCADTYTVNFSGDTNSDLLGISWGGTAMTNRPYIELGTDATNIYLTCSETGSSLSGSVELSAPTSEGSLEIRFYGSRIRLTDAAYLIESDLIDFGSINWMWVGETVVPDSLAAEAAGTVDFVSTGSGVGVTVNWY